MNINNLVVPAEFQDLAKCQFAFSDSFRRFSICLKLFISAGRKSTVTIDEYSRANSAMMSWFRKFTDVSASIPLIVFLLLSENVCSFQLSFVDYGKHVSFKLIE